MNPTELGRDLTIAETSAALNVTNPTIYKMIARGDLDSYTVGRARRITQESIQRLRSGQPAPKRGVR